MQENISTIFKFTSVCKESPQLDLILSYERYHVVINALSPNRAVTASRLVAASQNKSNRFSSEQSNLFAAGSHREQLLEGLELYGSMMAHDPDQFLRAPL